MALAISLDVENAFNSLPWPVIRGALEKKGFPLYLGRIIDSYLSNRVVKMAMKEGKIGVKAMTAGVPQGSIMGPLLWNIAYDYVLDVFKEPGCSVLCYADDTLVIATAKNRRDLVGKANLQTSLVTKRIRELGLRVSARKTEAIVFLGRRTRLADPIRIIMEEEQITVSARCMKYLGIMLDDRLTFKQHFEYIGTKASKFCRALCRLMPNHKGPREKKRKLYANVVNSVLTYGAPVWCEELCASRKSQTCFSKITRNLAIRIISAYRTALYEATTILARLPLLYLVVALRKRVYLRIKDLCVCVCERERRLVGGWRKGD